MEKESVLAYIVLAFIINWVWGIIEHFFKK